MLLSSDTDASLGEQEDIELLEQALEKALHVRTGTRPKKAPSKQSAPQSEMPTAAKEGEQASAASKETKKTTRRTFKSSGFDRKDHIRPGMSMSVSECWLTTILDSAEFGFIEI